MHLTTPRSFRWCYQFFPKRLVMSIFEIFPRTASKRCAILQLIFFFKYFF
jgi:hypothetical protein